MKKIFLLLTLCSILLTGCNNDNDNSTPTLNAAYLKGTWVEKAPAENYVFKFEDATTTLLYQGEISTEIYNYAIQDGRLVISDPEDETRSFTYDIEIVDQNTFKLTTLYFYLDCANCEQTVSTFKRQ